MKIALAAALLVAATSSSALAQKEDAKDLAAQDCKRFRKAGQACVLDFKDGDTLEVDVKSGSGFDHTARGIASFSSLIRVRTDFRAEIIRAAEDI